MAEHGDRLKPGRIYIAPPDNHLLLDKDRVLVTKGSREHRYRPGIDPSSAQHAVAHGARVIGVVLTGMLDDGTAGLMAIKRCGGVTVVQDPSDAAYSGRPVSALDNIDVEFCVALSEMGPLLAKLVVQSHGKSKAVPSDIRTEARIAERVLSDVAQVNGLGDQVPYNCPKLRGVLWEVDKPSERRYRCHTGHSYTDPALLASQSKKIEAMLWIALRMFEGTKNLLTSMAKTAVHRSLKSSTVQRLGETEGYISRIRAMLLSPQSDSADNTVTRVKGVMARPRKAQSTR